jgi:hypothetical protein
LFDSGISGNVIDLCPVGAISGKKYDFFEYFPRPQGQETNDKLNQQQNKQQDINNNSHLKRMSLQAEMQRV